MKFKPTLSMKMTIKKKKEYEFKDIEKYKKKAKGHKWENPLVVSISCCRYLAYFNTKGGFQFDCITGIHGFEELTSSDESVEKSK